MILHKHIYHRALNPELDRLVVLLNKKYGEGFRRQSKENSAIEYMGTWRSIPAAMNDIESFIDGFCSCADKG